MCDGWHIITIFYCDYSMITYFFGFLKPGSNSLMLIMKRTYFHTTSDWLCLQFLFNAQDIFL